MKQLLLILVTIFVIIFTSGVGYGATEISGTIHYTGTKTGTILVAVWTTPDIQHDPTAMIQLDSPGSYAISGLADGTYYLASVITTPSQDEIDIQKTDPWGVYGTLGNLAPITITGGSSVSGIDVTLTDGTEENPNPFYQEQQETVSPDVIVPLPETTKAGSNPSIVSDGSSFYLYKQDYEGADRAKVFKINPYSGNVIATYQISLVSTANGISWIGSMAWHKGAIWVEGGYGDPSGVGRKAGIFRIDLETSKSFDQIPAGAGIENMSGLASDGVHLYAGIDLNGDVDDRGIVKFDPDGVSEIPTSLFFLLSDSPGNISYGRNYLWLYSNGMKKINPVTGYIEANYDKIPFDVEMYFDNELWKYDENDNTLKAFSLDVQNGVAEDTNTLHPSAFTLSQNFPNPFNPLTTIEFSVPHSQFVTLRVFNAIGEEVARLFDGNAPSGSHTIAWDASGCASGLYFYRLEAGATTLTKKLLLLK